MISAFSYTLSLHAVAGRALNPLYTGFGCKCRDSPRKRDSPTLKSAELKNKGSPAASKSPDIDVDIVTLSEYEKLGRQWVNASCLEQKCSGNNFSWM